MSIVAGLSQCAAYIQRVGLGGVMHRFTHRRRARADDPTTALEALCPDLALADVDETHETFEEALHRLADRHAGDDDPILVVTHREGMYDLCGGRRCGRISYCGLALVHKGPRGLGLVKPPSAPSAVDHDRVPVTKCRPPSP